MCEDCIFNIKGICDIFESPAKKECFLKEEGEINEESCTFNIDRNELIGIPKEYIGREIGISSFRSL